MSENRFYLGPGVRSIKGKGPILQTQQIRWAGKFSYTEVTRVRLGRMTPEELEDAGIDWRQTALNTLPLVPPFFSILDSNRGLT